VLAATDEAEAARRPSRAQDVAAAS
jgi:hypothetical protein